ncbi:hypothetical protein JX265_000716 [Neoarthrinium moseri]|uniref:Helicase-like protein n=1 Tax=Neoarthrinium moseri TaxID=1658444 RepID=A0A9P9WZN1_9PEZI|nr:hypothetical protein JX265_000716 [Neoarthrinium moseri]
MQSLSALKRSAREFLDEAKERTSSPKTGKNDAQLESRQSKRELLKSLIRRARDAQQRGGVTNNTIPTPRRDSETVDSLRPTINSNKPLPSPPLPGTVDKVDGQPKKPVLKLDRIMASLSEAEIEKLFSGAPQYFARSLGHGTGAPHPSVAFPWDEDLRIRDLTDHTQIEDDAWGCVTTAPRLIQRDPLSASTPSSRKGPHFNVKAMERPNMLSMQGLEKGTMGYQAALELSVADALQEEQYGFDSLGSKSHVVIEQRQKLITSKDGLRQLDDGAIMEQLLVCEGRYQAGCSKKQLNTHELHNELFQKVLHPPTRIIDRNDPYSLPVQIYALVKVLAAPNAWVDFSRVEWRIRLGQILWGFPLDDEVEDGSSINEGIDDYDRSEERYWLLLQILLSCELLIRLDAITDGDEFGAANLRASEIHRFEKEANLSVRWSLLLARSWLENIVINKTEAPSSGTSTPKGWLTSLASKMTLKHDHMHGSHHVDHAHHLHHGHSEYQYAIQGRYVERQVFGLTQFARKLRWPEIESYITRVSINAPTIAQATPINTPLLTSDTRRSSYFGGDRKPAELQRKASRRRKIDAALHPSGWLSKSYVSGLVLPGEGLSHFLMSTLLENDQEAMAKLGPMANLCGGFVFSGKSFWSTACIVGRVLAAGRGSAECMGWISADVIPKALEDGWVNIDVAEIADDVAQTGKKARLWGKTIIERESDVLGDADSANVLPADFIIPHENNHSEPPPSNIRIDLNSLNLLPIAHSAVSTPALERDFTPFSEHSNATVIETYSPSMAFTMTHDGVEEDQTFNVSLAQDVYFVTAHPCAPSSYVKYFKSPTSPTIQQIDVAGNDWMGKSSSAAHITGHPLHKYYTYKTVHLANLLKRPDASLEELLGKSPSTSTNNNGSSSSISKTARVLVIDCITGFAPPRSPEMASLSRMSSISSSFGLEPTAVQLQLPTPPRDSGERPNTSTSVGSKISRIDPPSPDSKMRLPTRRRQFGSDLEILVRAICAERGWNALISRRRRGCLACAIREAGALGWRVIIRVE